MAVQMITLAQQELMALPPGEKPTEAMINAAFPIEINGPKACHRNDSGAILVGFRDGRLTTAWFNIDGESGYQKMEPKYNPPPTFWQRIKSWLFK